MWRDTPLAERAQWCRKIADAIEAKLQEIALLETLDCGKPIRCVLFTTEKVFVR
jgi:acyl-CoA reductase-like NAD-dependent aldehyde dehydrogenase